MKQIRVLSVFDLYCDGCVGFGFYGYLRTETQTRKEGK